MKIAIVSQYYAPEVIRIPDTLARMLSQRGHQVRVITGYPNYPDGKIFPGYKQRWNHVERNGRLEIRRVPLLISHSYNPIFRFANYLSFACSVALAYKWIKSADVVYVYATQMTPAIGPSLWHALFRVPYVLHIQDLWPESVTGSSMAGGRSMLRVISALLNPWLRYLYRTSSATIAIAPTMARMLVGRGVPESRIHMVLNWSDSEVDSPPETEQRHDRPVSIVYAGNLGDHQGLEAVIQAANRVKHISRVKVTLVGSGIAESRLRRLAHELDAHNVEFKGRVTPEQMGQIHASSDFQIVSLKDLDIFEGTIPSKFQASLSHSIPVITAVRGDVQRMVRENGIGFSCDPEDVQQLAAAFEDAAKLDPSERVKMGAAALQYYEDSMSIRRGVDHIEKILYQSSRTAGRKDEWT